MLGLQDGLEYREQPTKNLALAKVTKRNQEDHSVDIKYLDGSGIALHFAAKGPGYRLPPQDSIVVIAFTETPENSGVILGVLIPPGSELLNTDIDSLRDMWNGAEWKIDGEGNIILKGITVNVNEGEKGVARTNDAIKSTSEDDNTFWNFLSKLDEFLRAAPAGVGTAYATHMLTAGIVGVPNELKGKITGGSETVKVG